MGSLQLKGVSKSFGAVEVLRDIHLDVGDNEFTVFVGPSGCGKSTLLRLIAGLEDVTDGDIFIDDIRVNDLQPARRKLAMVFQNYALYPHMTVRENIAFGLRVSKYTREEIDRRVEKAAKTLHLENLLDRKPKELSGGQRQRVAIGRAIVKDPKIFLFDEPLSNLDASLRVQMRMEIVKLRQEIRTTMIYVTHDQTEAMTLADKIVVLRDGRIEQVGTPLDLYNNPQNKFVAGFIGSPQMNFWEVKVVATDDRQATVELVPGVTLSLPFKGAKKGDQLTLGVRPEHIKVGAGPSSVKIATLQGPVDFVEHLGSDAYFYVVLPRGDRLTVRDVGTSPVKIGDVVSIQVDNTHCHLFAADGSVLQRIV